MFGRKLAKGVVQFVYTLIQDHAVWHNLQFWEASFYTDVQKGIQSLYLAMQVYIMFFFYIFAFLFFGSTVLVTDFGLGCFFQVSLNFCPFFDDFSNFQRVFIITQSHDNPILQYYNKLGSHCIIAIY